MTILTTYPLWREWQYFKFTYIFSTSFSILCVIIKTLQGIYQKWILCKLLKVNTMCSPQSNMDEHGVNPLEATSRKYVWDIITS